MYGKEGEYPGCATIGHGAASSLVSLAHATFETSDPFLATLNEPCLEAAEGGGGAQCSVCVGDVVGVGKARKDALRERP
jgi:hypothetical protein